VHLSKVPEGQIIHTYDGSGEWVKIFTMGLEWHANDTEPLYWRAYNDGKQPPLVSLLIYSWLAFKLPLADEISDRCNSS
jgi:hypothetical protein